MSRTKRRSSVSLVAVVMASAAALVAGQGLSAGTAQAAGAVPSMNAPELGQGPFASMHMLLQKTILKINVLNLEVRLDKAAQGKLAALAQGKAYSEAMAAPLAQAVMGAGHALVQMEFKRDIPLKRWIGVVRDNLEEARQRLNLLLQSACLPHMGPI